MDFRDELRRKYPAKAQKADHEFSFKEAAQGHCRSCSGGTRESGLCQAYACWIWVVRPGAGKRDDPRRVRPVGVVPTVEEYAAMLPQYTDEERAAMTEQMRTTRARDEEDEG